MSFEEYGLSPELLSGLADVRIEEPTPLQNEVLPAALQGKNMLVKNTAEDEGTFLIPALNKIAQNGEVAGTQVLILTPSIERAKKIDELVWAMGYHAQISSALLDMKGKKDEQEQAVLDGAPVVVANPGRLIEILEKNNFHFRDLELIVIDEAHEMENFNLVNRVKDILRFVNGEPQTLILSGKKNHATDQLVKAALRNPEFVGFESNGQSTADAGPSTKEDVDIDGAKEKLEKANVEVVLNPKTDSDESEAKKEDDTEEEKESPKEKLEEAEVEVVLNPDSESSEKQDSSEEEETPKEKLDEAEVDVVLNPDQEDSKEETPENGIVLPDEAEKKLKEVSVKVVLKKDLPADSEKKEKQEASSPKEKKEDVEPVLANPVLQGEKDVLPDPVSRNLEQGYINVPPRMKISTLMAHLESSKAKKVVVFAASKRTTDRLFRIIRKKSWGVVSISEGIDDKTYDERFRKFTSGEMRVLLVGGIAAKDVEIEEVQEVINYDVPSEVEEYKYRAELVGRGKATQIISLVSKMDRDDIKEITDKVGYPPTELPLPKELEDKKKKKKSGSNKKKTNNRSKGRNKGKGSNNKRDNNRNRKRAKVKKLELPRPTYDGLSGGREGKKESSGGIFGWVKNLFD